MDGCAPWCVFFLTILGGPSSILTRICNTFLVFFYTNFSVRLDSGTAVQAGEPSFSVQFLNEKKTFRKIEEL